MRQNSFIKIKTSNLHYFNCNFFLIWNNGTNHPRENQVWPLSQYDYNILSKREGHLSVVFLAITYLWFVFGMKQLIYISCLITFWLIELVMKLLLETFYCVFSKQNLVWNNFFLEKKAKCWRMKSFAKVSSQ